MKLIKTLPLRFNNLPYRKKLLITHSLVLVVPIIVLGFYSFYQSRKMLINSKLTDIDYYANRNGTRNIRLSDNGCTDIQEEESEL